MPSINLNNNNIINTSLCPFGLYKDKYIYQPAIYGDSANNNNANYKLKLYYNNKVIELNKQVEFLTNGNYGNILNQSF